MPYLAIFWELFPPRKFVGETHFRGRPGRELIDAAAFAASDLVIKIACPQRSPVMPATRRPRQSVFACKPKRRACELIDALVVAIVSRFFDYLLIIYFVDRRSFGVRLLDCGRSVVQLLEAISRF
jgi:hypothetical protein